MLRAPEPGRIMAPVAAHAPHELVAASGLRTFKQIQLCMALIVCLRPPQKCIFYISSYTVSSKNYVNSMGQNTSWPDKLAWPWGVFQSSAGPFLQLLQLSTIVFHSLGDASTANQSSYDFSLIGLDIIRKTILFVKFRAFSGYVS